MINALIDRYRRTRNLRELSSVYESGFAFVGIGSHSRSNLYPVIDYLHLDLRWICCTDPAKVPLIQKKMGVKATTSLDEVLTDPAVKGVFVATSPAAHFSLASKILGSGKHLFIEKPPCRNMDELERLIALEKENKVTAIAGLQRRYAPAIQILKSRLKKGGALSYHLHYSTGAYPEGDALLDLFIHPLDEVCHIFGDAEIVSRTWLDAGKGARTLLLTLSHGDVCGTLELSTAYSWTSGRERLSVNTKEGVYLLEDVENLTFTPHPKKIAGIPSEKIWKTPSQTIHLCNPAHAIPVIPNNQIYTQGFYGEIETFANIVEGGRKSCNCSSLESLRSVYKLIGEL